MELENELTKAFSLENRVAVITGGGSGLGQEVSRIFALAGARLVLVDLDQAGMEATKELVGKEGVLSCRRVDISVREKVETLADEVAAETGRLDVWVNCAALGYVHPLMETDPQMAERVIAVNMMGSYWCCAAAGRVMGGIGHGSIINISSGGGSVPNPSNAVYSMTKAAVNSMTWSFAAGLGSQGIRVNAVSPGWFETPMSSMMYRDSSGQIDPEKRDSLIAEMTRRSPLRLLGRPSDIAFACLYLAADASRFITGQILPVNGGTGM